MNPDPVIVDVRDAGVPRACADVLRTCAPTMARGRADAARWFGLLPGLTLVAVVLPGDQVVFVTRKGDPVFVTAWQPLVAEYVYAWWVASSASSARTVSACGDPSDR